MARSFARVIRTRYAVGSARLLPIGDLHVVRNHPRVARLLRLRHRRDLVTPRAHRVEHLVDLLRSQIVRELEIDLHARRAIAGRKALDFLVRENSVRGRLQMSDPELLVKVGHDVFRAVDGARQTPADLQHVLADRPRIEQRIKGNRRLNLRHRKLEHFRRGLHRLRAYETLVLLEQMHQRQQRRPSLLVLRNNFLTAWLKPLAQRRKVLLAFRHCFGARHDASEPLVASPSRLRSCCSASSLPPSLAPLVGRSLLGITSNASHGKEPTKRSRVTLAKEMASCPSFADGLAARGRDVVVRGV
jgi:hypothetical protein